MRPRERTWPSAPWVLDARYRVEAPVRDGIARGMIGRLHRGTQLALGRPVLIQIADNAVLAADPGAGERLVREGRAQARLRHANVMAVFDSGESEAGEPYLVMEMLEGRLLDEIIAAGGLPPTRAARIILQVCRALSEGHARGIAHGALGPERIALVSWAGDSDFVKLIGVGRDESDGVQQGKEASDVIAVGGLIRAMLAGDRRGRSEPAVRASLLSVARRCLRARNPASLLDVTREVEFCLTRPRDGRGAEPPPSVGRGRKDTPTPMVASRGMGVLMGPDSEPAVLAIDAWSNPESATEMAAAEVGDRGASPHARLVLVVAFAALGLISALGLALLVGSWPAP